MVAVCSALVCGDRQAHCSPHSRWPQHSGNLCLQSASDEEETGKRDVTPMLTHSISFTVLASRRVASTGYCLGESIPRLPVNRGAGHGR